MNNKQPLIYQFEEGYRPKEDYTQKEERGYKPRSTSVPIKPPKGGTGESKDTSNKGNK